jgi:hypothetical protein
MKTTALALLCAACAGGPRAPEPVAVGPTPLAPAPRSFDARSWAAEYANAAECETAARRMHDDNSLQGWEALKGCVEKQRYARGVFTHLNLVTGGFWDEDLQTRPDAARLIARVIALRGGDVEGDLPTAQKSRVPVFSLAAALRQPDVYKGRWLVLRGRLADLRSEGNVHTALLNESALRSAEREVKVGTRFKLESESQHRIAGDLRTTRYGDATAKGESSSSYRSTRSEVKSVWDNEKVVTGRQALGRLQQADPFLEPNKDFIFLARFDGVRNNDQGDAMAVIAIASYFEPGPLLIE